MANSIITISFITPFEIGDIIRFSRRQVSEPTNVIIEQETYANTRLSNFIIPIETPGFEDYFNYAKYFNLDYNWNNLYTLTINHTEKKIIIELINQDWEFVDFFATSDNATAVINNVVQSTFNVVSDVVSPYDDDICNYVEVGITATEPIKSLITNDITFTIGAPNIYKISNLIRGIDSVVQMISENDEVVFVGTYHYDVLGSENITVQVLQTFVGASLYVNVINVIGLELEYSLDNVNWQTSNVFTGQEEGTKFLYVRDQFGCVKSKEYTVDEFGSREPYLYISKANSINYSEIIEVDNCSVFKNDNNTLAYDSLVKNPTCQELLFQTCDNTPTQFKSNYKNISVILRKENGTDTEILINKMTSNLNRFKSLDCIYYKYREGKLGLRFESGLTYDEYGAEIEEYSLNGNLPEFAIIGEYVSIVGIGTLQITDVLFDEDKKKRAIIFNYNYSGVETISVASSIYDLLQFEVYEFYLDWSIYGEGYYDVVITNQDDSNGTVIHNSEVINILEEHINTFALRYYNLNNRDVFYKFGIQHFIRVPLVHIEGIPKDDNDINISDNKSTVTNSDVYELDEIEFDIVTKEYMRKLVIALSCEKVFGNGIGYIKNGNISTTNIKMSNQYSVKANMLKTGVNYNNNRSGQSGIDNGTIIQDIPIIITDGTNFIKQ